MKTYYEISKEVALIVAGAFLGILAVPFETQISRNLEFITIILVILILYGIGLVEWLASFWFWSQKKKNFRRSTIGIYAPFEIQIGLNSTWVDVDVQSIGGVLERNGIRNEVARNESVYKTHSILINPFGGVYPEKDLSKLQSLDKIFEFVRDGGIYINIADIPFYYAFDDVLNRRVDTTPLAGDFSITRSFFQTILTKKLHCFILGLPKGMPENKNVERVVQLPSPRDNLFDAVTEINDGKLFSPVLKIAYGKGFFIFSTLRVNKHNIEANLMRVINSAVNILDNPNGLF